MEDPIQRQIEEIRAHLDELGLDLHIARIRDLWFAATPNRDSAFGNAAYGTGKSELEAAQHAFAVVKSQGNGA